MTRILTIIALLFATPVFSMPLCTNVSNISCLNMEEGLYGGFIGTIKNGQREGIGSQKTHYGSIIGNFMNDTLNGWSIYSFDDGVAYINWEKGKRKEGAVFQNGKLFIIFGDTSSAEPNMVLGSILLPDGRSFKSRFRLNLNEEMILRDQEIAGVMYFPESSKNEKYVGEVQLWGNKQVDLHGFGLMYLKNGEIKKGDYIRNGAGVENRVGAAPSAIAGLLTLGLTTAIQAKDRLGSDKIVASVSEIESQVDGFLRGFSINEEVKTLGDDFNLFLSRANAQASASSMEQYKEQCRAFGFEEFGVDGKTKKEFRSCVQETFFKMEEMKMLKQARENELEQQQKIESERTQLIQQELKEQNAVLNNQSRMRSINSYLDREQRRIDAINQGIRNNAPITCTTSPPMGGYVNTTCR